MKYQGLLVFFGGGLEFVWEGITLPSKWGLRVAGGSLVVPGHL
jgi:hypothetical protein